MASRGGTYRPGRFLPRDPRAETPYRLTPQLVFRIGILGFLALAAFGVLFFRLWALQVLSGTQYLQAAQNNQLRERSIPAPRGPIKDRYGRLLVDNTSTTVVQVVPADLPKHGAYAELRRLARVLNVPLADITSQIEKHRDEPLTPVTVKEFVSEPEVHYLSERGESEFPGVETDNTFVRSYRYGSLASHLVGYVGEISPEQLKHERGYRLGDKVGQSGIEAAFDKILRGRAGLKQRRVDSLGHPKSPFTITELPVGGYALRLTLDAKLQQAAQQAVIDGINRAQANRQWYARAGAIVAIDPRDGAIRALASYPTYDPSVFTTRKERDLAPLLDPRVAEEADFPALNRAIAGVYPPGSTFKPVTALSAMQEHILRPYDSLQCTGQLTIDKQVFKNWDPYANQAMTLPTAIAQSCDTYFYQVGKRFYDLPGARQPLQEWAHSFGFGEPTGLDVGPEEAGLLPTIKWKHETFTKKTDPCCWEIDRLWKSGDSVQLAIGQKDMLATPLQMARFYALIANGGQLVTPHVVADVEQSGTGSGTAPGPLVLRRFQPPAKELNLDPAAIGVIREGLYEATHSTLGTSSGVFGHFPIGIAGKTGTAERTVDVGDYSRLVDTSWWCGFGPYEKPELVVCAVIENGGFGGEAAAPSALQVFERYFGVKAGSVAPAQAD